MNQRKSGMALWIVLFAAMIIGFVLSLVMLQQKRDTDLSKLSNDEIKFNEVLNRVRMIFESRALCTCNLRGLSVDPSGAITASSRMRIDEGPGPIRPVFGFYKLNSADPSGCETVLPAINPMTDSVLNLQQGVEYPTALNAHFFQISQFQLMQTLSPTLSQYKAKLTFGAKDKFKLSKSNSQSPLELDVYVEIIAGPQNIIKQCFQPKIVSTPSSPPPTCVNGATLTDPSMMSLCCESLPSGGSASFTCGHGFPYDPGSPSFDPSKCCEMTIIDAAAKTCQCTGGWVSDGSVSGCPIFVCP